MFACVLVAWCSGSCCRGCSCLSIYLILSVYLQAWKRSHAVRPPQFLSSTTSKTQQFRETSSIFEVGNIKNEAILRDFLAVWNWQHQKRSNSARHPSIMESWVQRWRPRTNAFCDFSSPCLWSIAPATKKWCQVIQVLHLSHKIISPRLKIWCSKTHPTS